MDDPHRRLKVAGATLSTALVIGGCYLMHVGLGVVVTGVWLLFLTHVATGKK